MPKPTKRHDNDLKKKGCRVVGRDPFLWIVNMSPNKFVFTKAPSIKNGQKFETKAKMFKRTKKMTSFREEGKKIYW